LPTLPVENILAEPSKKNTAPCVAYIAFKLLQKNPKASLVVAPSDHMILDGETFKNITLKALDFVDNNETFITLGIKPTYPNTGYGYIQYDTEATQEDIFKVKTFTEKPNLEIAKSFLQSGDFLWNSGIFIWSTQSIINAFEKHDPEMFQVFKDGTEFYNTDKEASFIKKAYVICKSNSIDYSVMEKAKNVYVRESLIGWSDLGTWGSLYSHVKHSPGDNAVVGKNVMLYDSKNCIINVSKDKLAVIQGLEDYIVVESENTLLICKKTDEQQIRNFVNDVKVQKGDKFI
jgi:mannose-1-phosphate guanylyltransferase